METEKNTELINNVRRYYADKTIVNILEMSELAPGVICVHDDYDKRRSDGEYNVYFDTSKWRFSHPSVWAQDKGGKNLASYLENINIKILPGTGFSTYPKSFEDFLELAKQELVPTTCWYDKPISVD